MSTQGHTYAKTKSKLLCVACMRASRRLHALHRLATSKYGRGTRPIPRHSVGREHSLQRLELLRTAVDRALRLLPVRRHRSAALRKPRARAIRARCDMPACADARSGAIPARAQAAGALNSQQRSGTQRCVQKPCADRNALLLQLAVCDGTLSALLKRTDTSRHALLFVGGRSELGSLGGFSGRWPGLFTLFRQFSARRAQRPPRRRTCWLSALEHRLRCRLLSLTADYSAPPLSPSEVPTHERLQTAVMHRVRTATARHRTRSRSGAESRLFPHWACEGQCVRWRIGVLVDVAIRPNLGLPGLWPLRAHGRTARCVELDASAAAAHARGRHAARNMLGVS